MSTNLLKTLVIYEAMCQTKYLNCIVVHFMVVKCGDLDLYISIKFVQHGIYQFAKFATCHMPRIDGFRPAHESTPYQLSIAETLYSLPT